MARKGINVRAGFDLNEFSKSSQNLVRSLKKTGNKMKAVGKSLSRNLTAPITLLGGLAVKTFADFEQSMAKVAATTGATGDELKGLLDLTKRLGISTRFTASEVAELALNYAKLGFSSDEISKITEATLELALATGEDLADSAEVAGATLRGFGLSAESMQRVVDVMAKSFSSSGLTLERFSVSMAKIAPLANAANVSIERVAAMQSVLASSGVEASTIGTSLRKIFKELAKGGLTYEQAMNKINTATNKVSVSNDIFGDRAMASAIILASQGEEVAKLTDSYRDSGGAAKKMADIMDNTLQGSLLKVKSAIEGVAITFGEELAPFVDKVAKRIAALAIRFSELTPFAKRMVVIIAAVTAAIGPLILAIGVLTTALAFLAANPIVLIITGIIVVLAALTAAIIFVKNNLGAFSDFFFNIWVKIANTFIDGVKFMLKGWTLLADALGLDIGQQALDFLDSFKLKTIENVREFGSLGESIKKSMFKAKKSISDFSSSSISDIAAVGTSVENFGNGGSESVNKVTAAWKRLNKEIALIRFSLPKPKDFFDSLPKPEELKAWTGGALSVFEQMGADISDALNRGLQSLASNGAQLVGEFFTNILSFSEVTIEDFGKGILGAIGSFMKDFGEAMIATGVALAIADAAIKTLNPALAIAGGIALVAAGAALSNISSGGISGSPSGAGSPSSSGGRGGGFETQNILIETESNISGREIIITSKRERKFSR